MKRAFAIPILLLMVLASYAPAIRDGFVWDDTALILRDPLIRSWRLIPEGFNHFLFVDATSSDFYRPLQRLTYTIEYQFFGVQPALYHLTNILLHAAAAIALLLFAEALLAAFGLDAKKYRGIAFVAASIWAIHPVQSAAVIYVSGRADPLAALFGFTGCYLALCSLRASPNRSFPLLVCAGAAFLMSALSKENGLIFPVLILVIFGLLKQRQSAMRFLVVTALIGLAYFSFRFTAEHEPPPPFGDSAPIADRPITMARAVAEYAGLIVVPFNLHMDRSVKDPIGNGREENTVAAAWRELQTLGGILLVATAIYCAFRIRKRDPLLFALLVLTGISYLPVSGILRLNGSIAEHWIYLPTAFLFLAGAVLVGRKMEIVKSVAGATTSFAFATWMLFLGTRTFVRTFDWKDQRTFLTRTIADGGDSARMLINMGALESGENRLDLAQHYLEAALNKAPGEPLAMINLAAVAVKQNDFSTAHRILNEATRLPLVAAQAHELLTILENKEYGRTNMLRLRLAAHTGSSNWLIEKRYIRLLAETGATGAAIHELHDCLQMEWYRAESWQLLGQLLSISGHPKEAEEAFACANNYDVHLATRPAPL